MSATTVSPATLRLAPKKRALDRADDGGKQLPVHVIEQIDEQEQQATADRAPESLLVVGRTVESYASSGWPFRVASVT